MSNRHPLRILAAMLALGIALAAPAGRCMAQEMSSTPKLGENPAQNFKVPPRDGEFRRSFSPGIGGISCTQISKPGAPPPTDLTYAHCLRMGPLKLGMELYQLQIALSNLKTIPEPNIVNPRIVDRSPSGITTALFPITTMPSGDGLRMQSYLVAVIDKAGVVQVLQLTGKPSEASASMPFSSLLLGTPRKRVLELLGNPSSISDVPQVQGKLWSYAPFPFTVEMVNGTVHSMRIHAPSDDDKRKPFVPLASLAD
jgi:hypothetical protein